MELKNLLLQKSSTILEKWFDLILETYPADTKRFLKQQRDRFANPVGTAISQEMERLFQGIVEGVETDKVYPSLERIIRIRAVQDFTPAQAVAFMFMLKGIIRAELGRDLRDQDLVDQLLAFESRIDELGLLAFEIYMKCREKLYEIRMNETRNQVSGLLRKAGLGCAVPGPEADQNPPKGPHG